MGESPDLTRLYCLKGLCGAAGQVGESPDLMRSYCLKEMCGAAG